MDSPLLAPLNKDQGCQHVYRACRAGGQLGQDRLKDALPLCQANTAGGTP